VVAGAALAPGSRIEASPGALGGSRGLSATKPMKLDAAQQKRLLRLYEPVSELISIFGISRSTLFRTLRLMKQREPMPA
jgi:DNA invertase Pin-like site-specific DNA recombinase